MPGECSTPGCEHLSLVCRSPACAQPVIPVRSLEPPSASPGCALLVPLPSSSVSPEVPDRICNGDVPPTAARRFLHSPSLPEPLLAVPWVTTPSPLPGQRQRGDPGPPGLPRDGGMATQPYAATASYSPVALIRAPLCLCDAAQFCLCCGTRGNKEHCLDVPFFPSFVIRAGFCFSQQQCPLNPPLPTELS